MALDISPFRRVPPGGGFSASGAGGPVPRIFFSSIQKVTLDISPLQLCVNVLAGSTRRCSKQLAYAILAIACCRLPAHTPQGLTPLGSAAGGGRKRVQVGPKRRIFLTIFI